jgi:hypothetical protein
LRPALPVGGRQFVVEFARGGFDPGNLAFPLKFAGKDLEWLMTR